MPEPGATSGSLKAELELFEAHRKEWFALHPEEFVVVTGATVVGFFPDFETAFRAGLKEIGQPEQPFLVKQVWAEEPVYLIY